MIGSWPISGPIRVSGATQRAQSRARPPATAAYKNRLAYLAGASPSEDAEVDFGDGSRRTLEAGNCIDGRGQALVRGNLCTLVRK